ncbi:putative ferric-chelate reductase 1 isoform X1 [Hyla sarda]|uniref:putative ferric-chelate reductase 1 isoform X1 n=1 Tax=Hyla sarda TaxID=327740 RepID=UPI0024C29783|nr:putative ferric-chelate reductase 1 isoform X1 [Hyla sarda]XP_056379309.1 putative ferric-chelate reductase 1 isoform X1 [Hyla sarda]
MDLPVRQFTLLSLIFLPMHSNGFPNGKVEIACRTMMPSHDGVDAQISPSPYSLSFSSVNYTGILGFIVTLGKELPNATDFKGFMFQARAPGQITPQGTFVVTSPDAQTLTCTSTNDTVSHTSNSMKSSVSVIWLPPKKAITNIQFRAAVVQTKPIFWINVLSDIIPLAGAGAQVLAPGPLLCSTVLAYVLFTI